MKPADKQTTISEWRQQCDEFYKERTSKLGRFGVITLEDCMKAPSVPRVVNLDTSYGIPSFDLLDEGMWYWYEIDCRECNTGPKLVGWIAHLLDKNWVTKEHLRQFIQLVTERYPDARIG